ncbi:ABC-type multidrug transport system, ATPase component [Thermococcus kodakarensis KOD1]|uniref:ABC-type multidrug transport system, ATPase component n=1 Tax=Thermococcus kodakarensis (strain ATCC BAA-918 / JCM 12380 / KOD1) TaxID=69014 RepID=Q5JG38_THEKO|nr:ABC transporter ATP-binding protein [Thermococcus kodakarensis]WCN28726.1 ABC transporter ATP-binding protein [Thermococcus kodakarensis]WCN31023.1 ABC transporter ATP-binding protein [Thermococcus kodakarensis]BAD84883.1 ABC-type multidrug transport system, ATPase component [Thermococcus kodakarensis KOD1]
MPVIEVKNIRKYYGDVRGVENLSFEVEEGEIYGFLGPNGAGKTTTVKILVKIIRDYEGTAKVLGKDLREWGKDYYNRIGVSFEFPAVYSRLTALENLEFFASFYKKHLDPMEVLKMVGLDKEADQLVAGFSKGMRKKLDIARALLPDPDILFLDEPLEGLDPASARKFKDLFLEMRESGKTIFLTTHNMYVADELCDRVAFIVDGSVRLVDNPGELKVKMGKRLVKVEYVENGSVKTAEFPLEGIGQNEEFLNILRNHEIRRINTEEPTLEEIFLKVTGRRLV